MTLKEMFDSKYQVDPVLFQTVGQELFQPITSIYTNSDRAKQIMSNGKSDRTEQNWENPYKNDRDLWIQDMIYAYKSIGLPDKAIKNLLAKNALESGWGKHAQGAYNFGNLTANTKWHGKYTQGTDKDASGKKITQKFRVYNSLEEFVRDEIKFLEDYYDFNPNDDFDTFISKLQGNNPGNKRYAAVKDYDERVKRVYDRL